MHLEKRILVTGGAGFLGSHLCERLVADGANVICVDSFFSGARRNIEQLMRHPRFELIRHDVTFPLYVEVDENQSVGEKCGTNPFVWKWTKFTIWHARHHRFIISAIQSRPPRRVCMVPSICWV